MVKYDPGALDRTFGALADATRRAIVARLAGGALPVTELAQPFAMSLPAISKHLNVLQDAGLVVRKKHGRQVLCGLAADPMKDAAAWIAAHRRFWQARLDALADYLDDAKPKEGATCRATTPRAGRRSRSGAATARRRRKSSARGPSRRS
ncbi:MAG: helix-turn-helix transcriptional regulator [Betaproteobacteria bacterium]|nr:helix-turn-helix transcriptional regulator [Betaproteobacteria bacterium]